MHTQYPQASTAIRATLHSLILIVHRRPIPLVSYSFMGLGILDAELNFTYNSFFIIIRHLP